jgi:hypothetical protein
MLAGVESALRDEEVPMDDTPETLPITPEEPGASEEAPPKRPSIIDAVADLLQFIVDWLRQEAEAAVREKVVLPVQRLGLTLASAGAAGCLAVFGIAFIATGVFILLGEWITYPGALLLIGGVLVVGSVVFTVLKMKGIQR